MMFKITTFLILVFAAFTARSQEAAAIVIAGKYQNESLTGGNVIRFTSKEDFTVTLSGTSWIIELVNPDYAAKHPGAKTIFSCDGTNIYKVEYPNNVGEIETSAYPTPEDVDLEYIWLAYASPFFLTKGEGEAKPPLVVDRSIFSRDDYFCTYLWTTNIEDKSLRKLTFNSDGQVFTRDHYTGELNQLRHHPPFDKGFTLLECQWEQATNLVSLAVPLDVNINVFQPKVPASSSNDLNVVQRIECVSQSVSFTSEISVPASPPAKTYIFDRRFANQGYAVVNYFDTNGIWPGVQTAAMSRVLSANQKISIEDEALLEEGFKIMGDPLTPQKKEARTALISHGILVLIILPPTILALFILIRSRTKPKTKTK